MASSTRASAGMDSAASFRASVGTASAAFTNAGIPAINGLGRSSRLPSALAYEKMTSGAAFASRSWTCRAKSSSTSALACAAPAARSNSAGSRGLGRGGGGQRSSFMPITHNASKSRPALSRTPSTWMAGRPRVSGWKMRCRQSCARRRTASLSDSLPSRVSSLPKPSRTSTKARRAWNSWLDRERSPGQPSAARQPRKTAAQRPGRWRARTKRQGSPRSHHH